MIVVVDHIDIYHLQSLLDIRDLWCFGGGVTPSPAASIGWLMCILSDRSIGACLTSLDAASPRSSPA